MRGQTLDGCRYAVCSISVYCQNTGNKCHQPLAEDPKVAEEADVSAAFLDGPGA